MQFKKRIEVIKALKLLAEFDLEQQALFNYATTNPDGLEIRELAHRILRDEIRNGRVQKQ